LLTGKGTGADPAYASLVTTRLTADNAAIAAGTTPAQVVNLTQAVNTNEEWDIEWILDVVFSVATDVLIINVNSTAGTITGQYTIEGANGAPNTGAATVKRASLACNTAIAASANCPGNTGSTTLKATVTIRARFKQTVANGTAQVLVRAVTSAGLTSGTATVKTQSQMIATRIV
jgi:hypothetical protein